MTVPLSFSLPLGGTIKVDCAALATMKAYLQVDRHSAEAGGILIGRLISGSQDVVVDSATPPQPKDKRSRFRIDRLDLKHQRLVDRAFTETGGTYLGEWHTHPEAHPTPSCIDQRNWRRKGKEDTYYGDGLLFIILGTESMGAWHGERNSMVLTAIGTVLYDQPPDDRATRRRLSSSM